MTILFDKDAFVELVSEDPMCLEFTALAARIEALQRDLVEVEGLPNPCRTSLILCNVEDAIANIVRRVKADVKKYVMKPNVLSPRLKRREMLQHWW